MTGSVGSLSLLLVVSDPPEPVTDGSGPVTVIIVAVLVLLGTFFTAMGPAFVEILKNRRRPTSPKDSADTAQADSVVQPAKQGPLTQYTRTSGDALDLVEQAVLDYRSQRDAANARVDGLAYRLDKAQQTISNQAIIIARLEAELANSQQHSDLYGHRRPAQPTDDDDPHPGWRR